MKLPFLISNGMVIQREKDFKLWGYSKAEETIHISFLGKKYSATANENGLWEASLGSLPAGGPYEMAITAGIEEVVIRDILVGDVWLCSGQSNMEMTMQRVHGKYPQDMKANNPWIRQFKVPQEYDFHGPRSELNSGCWTLLSPATVGSFSAVGYFFAKELHARFGVPIGLLASAVGGTPIHSWMSRELLHDFPEELKELKSCEDDAYVEKVIKEDNERITAYYNELDRLDSGLREGWFAADYDTSSWDERDLVAPFEGDLKLPGAIWLRKEVDIPEAMAGKPATLYFGTVTDADFIYLSGRLIGNTTYRYPPREYRIDALPSGRCNVAVRLLSYYGCGGIVAGKQYAIVSENQVLSLEGSWKYRRGAVLPPLKPARQFNFSPTGLFNGMIAPLTRFPIKGVIWYQGESDGSRPERYAEKFGRLVKDWRKYWGNIPFLYTQLANYSEGGNWPRLREEQRKSLSIPGTAMVVTIDVGEYNDLHPLNKEAVGQRLALAAMKLAYGEDVVFSGPMIREARATGDSIVLYFDHAEDGLFCPFNPVTGFEISGADGSFYPASAVIDGNTVILSSEKVKRPVIARFGWENSPETARLYNKAGLPASPFEISAC